MDIKIFFKNKEIGLNINSKKEITVKEILEHKLLQEIKDEILGFQIDNNSIFDLNNLDIKIQKNKNIVFICQEDQQAKKILNHSAAHLLAQALKKLYPKILLTIGPAIENGFYYDIDLNGEKISEKDFEQIEKEMHVLASKNIPIQKQNISYQKAIELFKDNKYKIEIINKIKNNISIYKQDDFFDLCSGPHVKNTSFLKYFKILSISGSYWHGDTKKNKLTRIYGISFFHKNELEDYLESIKKQKEIDHKKIGKNLDIFFISNYGQGMPFWLYNGVIIKNELKNFWFNLHKKNGYSFIETPIILSNDLWITSGHWKNYKSNMFTTTIDNKEFAIKPMNCPGCILVYNNKQHSYKELPIKIGEFGLVHRYENSGAVNGLFRARAFTQDDAHIFCRKDQMKKEIIKIIKIFDEIYSLFDLQYSIEISTRPEKYIGNKEDWDESEKILKTACKQCKKDFFINQGDGAFYGPKIDFKLKDSLNRIWQCGTIQLDMNLPKRFDIYYINEKNEKVTPIMLHRAAFGSIERFIGILLEHFNGILPLWLAPVQVIILPINNKLHMKYSNKIFNSLKKKEIRVQLDNSSESLSYRIKQAQLKKIIYTVIIGDNEIKNNYITYRTIKETTQNSVKKNDFLKMIIKNIKEKRKK